VAARRKAKRTRAPSKPEALERRQNHALREILDELLAHVREVAQRGSDMSTHDIEYSQQRLEWLADEVWRMTMERNEET
jgi:hypothetical protein